MSYYPMPFPMSLPYSMPGRPIFPPTLTTLYIGNLDDTVHEEQLFALFSPYGPIHSLKIVKDRNTGRSRGFGYINFIKEDNAKAALESERYNKIGKTPIRLMYKQNIHNTEASNIFVKNIDSSVTPKDLHELFSRDKRKVLSVKIATNNRGESLGYGYVLMENKEQAEAAIEKLNGYKLKEKEITCNEFTPKDKRNIRTKNNLYIKGLPTGKSETEIHNLIQNEFKKFGTIISLAARQSKDGKWFAFVCYDSPTSAEQAINELNNSNVFGPEPLYVAQHQSRHERQDTLRRAYSTTKNENNLFVRNLKPEVTKEVLQKAFSQFGEVGNVGVGQRKIKDDDTRGYGFVSFKVAQDALKAQSEGPKSEELKKLFIDGQEVYINFWQSKHQRDQFKASRSRRLPPHQRMPFNNMPRGPAPYGQFPGGPMNFPPFPMMGAMMRPPFGAGPRGPGGVPNRYPPKQQQRFQGGKPQYNQKPMGQGNTGRQPYNKTQQGGRPGPRGDYHNERTQPVQQQQIHQQPKQTPVAEPQGGPLEVNLTVHSLKEKLDDFLKLEPEKQRNILGELLYPKILRKSRPEHAPKITGMLVDFEVLTVQDILEMLEDDKILHERIEEAQELITSEGQN